MVFLFKSFSFLPLWLAHGIGAALGWLVFALSPTYRKRFLVNSQLAGYTFAQVAGAVASSGRMVAELPKLWMGTQGRHQGKAEAPFQWQDRAPIEAAYAAGKGVIFLTPHLGCFEMLAQALAQDFGPTHPNNYGEFTALYRPARKAWMAALVANSRNRPGLTAVPTHLVWCTPNDQSPAPGQSRGLAARPGAA